MVLLAGDVIDQQVSVGGVTNQQVSVGDVTDQVLPGNMNMSHW